mmetsp:Transcript_804/g.2295  ORF Transcript_804/g.2295 Transcript_804/m.2295 type:complete len:152 (+) Transcript_804:706-1161(+)
MRNHHELTTRRQNDDDDDDAGSSYPSHERNTMLHSLNIKSISPVCGLCGIGVTMHMLLVAMHDDFACTTLMHCAYETESAVLQPGDTYSRRIPSIECRYDAAIRDVSPWQPVQGNESGSSTRTTCRTQRGRSVGADRRGIHKRERERLLIY